jgi:hypothetical protein
LDKTGEDRGTTKALQFLCRHLLGLCVTYRHTIPEEAHLPSRFVTCSGTLLLIEGALYFLTAGHVLKALKELRDNKEVNIEIASLADIFGHRRVSDTPIPFDLTHAHMSFIDDEEMGLDFGVIPIGPHHARLLIKNGMVALSEENWSRQHKEEFEGYTMLGFPAELVSERISGSSRVHIEVAMIGVRRLELGHAQQKTTYPRFVGQIGNDLPFKSIEGMSGGVIFGFQTKPRLRYWIVAIQSSWERQTRTVYGCSLPVLASLMTHWARENVAILRELDANSAEICLSAPNATPPTEHLIPTAKALSEGGLL